LVKAIKAYLIQRVRSFGYAFKGIGIFFWEQAHPKIHLLAIIVITGLGLYLDLSGDEWQRLVMCMGLVLVAEAMNTAIEYVVDLVSPDYHPLAGKAKDVAAGAVLLSVIFCGIVWGMICLPKISALFS